MSVSIRGGRRSRHNDVTFDNREEVRQRSMTTRLHHLDQGGGHQFSKEASAEHFFCISKYDNIESHADHDVFSTMLVK